MTVSRAIVQCESSAEQPELVLITTDPNAKKKKNKRKRRRAAGANKNQDEDGDDEEDDDDDAPLGCWGLLLNALGCYFLYSYAKDWWSGDQGDVITSGATNMNSGLQGQGLGHGHHQLFDENIGDDYILN